jgi:signal transduction histidine kinase
LFTPFTRLNQVRAKGHGLGLSIARRIVEKLGGQVGVESNGVPGQGSRFFFTLPGAVNPTTPIAGKADRLLDAAKMTKGSIQAAG